MEELAQNLTQDEVLELIKDFPIQPLGSRLIITVNTDEEDELEMGGFGLAETQYVVAVGTRVFDEISPGQKVLLDLAGMAKTLPTGEFSIPITPVKVNGRTFARINDRNIDCIDNR